MSTIKNKIKSLLQKTTDKLQHFVLSQVQLPKDKQCPNTEQLEIISKLHQQIKTDLKRMITLQHASYLEKRANSHSPNLNKQIKQTLTTHINYIPTKNPSKFPAIGPQDKLHATRLTQHAQIRAHPGKANHFTALYNDEVGPNHIKVRYSKEDSNFTKNHLGSYHEHSSTFPLQIKEEVIKAHDYY